MNHKEPEISTKAAAGITRVITFTIPKDTKNYSDPVRSTCQSVIIAACKIGLLIICGTKKHKARITCKNLHQQRYCLLIKGIINYLVTLLSHWVPD
jgi:hypothetical protein